MGGLHSAPRNNNNGKGTKRALLIGCNYPNTKAELAGCVNDVHTWKELLTGFFNFDSRNIKVLVDVGEEFEQPTGKNIKSELTRIVTESRPGDVVFVQFSGHGVQVPADEDGDYEEDGLDEALAPTDLNLIIDDDLRDILSMLDPGAKFTMVCDCCHSGGMLDHEKIVISGRAGKRMMSPRSFTQRGINVKDVMKDLSDFKDVTQKKNRALDLETMADMLKDLAKKPRAIDVTHVRSALYSTHGDDASHAAIATKKRNLSVEEIKHINYQGPGKKPENIIDPNKGILITGCQSYETSADVTGVGSLSETLRDVLNVGSDGRSFGALSHTIVRMIKRHRQKFGDRPISNLEIVLKVRQLLNKSGFEQNPCLECSVNNSKENFIVW